MAKSWELQIGDIFLTSTGDAGGRPCRVVLIGAAALFNSYRANTSNAADGSFFNESPLTDGAGLPIQIQIPVVDTPVFDDLKTLITGLGLDGTTTIEGSGEPGSFTVTAGPYFNPLPFDFGDFSDDVVRSVVLNFMTTEINSIS